MNNRHTYPRWLNYNIPAIDERNLNRMNEAIDDLTPVATKGEGEASCKIKPRERKKNPILPYLS